MAKLMTAEEAVKAYIKDGMTIATNGFVGAVQPEGMMRAIQKSFLEGGTPRDLTLVHAAGQGGGADADPQHLRGRAPGGNAAHCFCRRRQRQCGTAPAGSGA